MSVKEENSYLEVPLMEMRKTYQMQIDSFDNIKASVRSLLGSASLIIALASTLQLLSGSAIALEWLWIYRFGLGLVGILYVLLIFICALALTPAYPTLPIAAEWDILVTAFKDLNENERMLKELSTILGTIDINRPLVQKYARYNTIATILLPVIVLILLLLTLIPRI